jgi:hypothetical protein
VKILTRPLWRIRLGRELLRYMLCGLSLAGMAASARFAIAPPRAQPARQEASLVQPQADLAAESYASLFARRYLTWNAGEPEAHERSLAPFVGAGLELGAGLRLPSGGREQVQWAEIAQQRESAPGEHVYTVAAQTDTAGLVYLTVAVRRLGDGSLAIAGYPAIVGAPAFVQAVAPERAREVSDSALVTVVERALRNYLASSSSDLAADLTPGARVSPPGLGLTLDSVRRVDWSPRGGSVVAVVQAQDGRGAQYTLGYELDVSLQQGRWEVSAVQMDPTK